MREGSTVPASAIPERAWGLAGRAVARETVMATDPFGGRGVRLEVPAGVEVTIADIQRATGCEHVVLFGGGVAWVERQYGCGDITMLWLRWLALGRGEQT